MSRYDLVEPVVRAIDEGIDWRGSASVVRRWVDELTSVSLGQPAGGAGLASPRRVYDDRQKTKKTNKKKHIRILAAFLHSSFSLTGGEGRR